MTMPDNGACYGRIWVAGTSFSPNGDDRQQNGPSDTGH